MAETEIKNIFPEELKINPEKGFDEHDIFGWKKQGKALIGLLNSTNQQMVLGLDAPWGSGKTTFLQMLAGELKKTNGQNSVIYFDAFEVDYMDDPFIALAGELSVQIEKNTKIDEKLKEKFTSSATNVGKVLAKSALKVGVKALTLNAVDVQDVKEDFADELAKTAESILDQEVETSIKAYKEKKAAVSALKSSLSEIAEDLTEGDKPLIFIIDELDRCKPDFALRILEQIKHLFSTSNVHFILSADYKQLGAMVKKAYGDEYDSDKYFHKFVQNVITLKHEDPVPKYLKLFCQNTILTRSQVDENKFLESYLVWFHEKHSISIRDMERILIILATTSKVRKTVQLADGLEIALATMKVINRSLFLKIYEGNFRVTDFEEFFGIDRHTSSLASPTKFLLMWTWIYFNISPRSTLNDQDQNIFDYFKDLYKDQLKTGRRRIIQICQQFMTLK